MRKDSKMKNVKKVKVEKKVKNNSTIYIRSIAAETKNKFYDIAKKNNLLPRELFEKLVSEGL